VCMSYLSTSLWFRVFKVTCGRSLWVEENNIGLIETCVQTQKCVPHDACFETNKSNTSTHFISEYVLLKYLDRKHFWSKWLLKFTVAVQTVFYQCRIIHSENLKLYTIIKYALASTQNGTLINRLVVMVKIITTPFKEPLQNIHCKHF